MVSLLGVSLGTHPDDASGWNGIINANGTMNWPGALFWLDAMNDANYLGFNDWRLPTHWSSGDTDELRHLYFDEFGARGIADGPPYGLFATGDLTEIAKFTNIGEYQYWTSGASDTGAYFFEFDLGGDEAGGKLNEWNVMVVRTGDVPVPATIWLFCSGLLGLVGIARRKKAA